MKPNDDYRFDPIIDIYNPLNGKDLACNLNQLKIDDDTGRRGSSQIDYSTESNGIQVFFKNLDIELCNLIRQYDSAVGCVAWLTHPDILASLAMMENGVSLIVQKEDFLRPDYSKQSYRNWPVQLRNKYSKLTDMSRMSHPSCLVGDLNVGCDSSLAAVRCVGNHNSDRNPASPRSHHKFLVFGTTKSTSEEGPCPHCKRYFEEDRQRENLNSYQLFGLENKACYDCHDFFVPQTVWTGSFNFTVNGTNSFENAVVMHEPKIVQAYYDEWAQILSLSEPLNWAHPWVHPEYRIGT